MTAQKSSSLTIRQSKVIKKSHCRLLHVAAQRSFDVRSTYERTASHRHTSLATPGWESRFRVHVPYRGAFDLVPKDHNQQRKEVIIRIASRKVLCRFQFFSTQKMFSGLISDCHCKRGERDEFNFQQSHAKTSALPYVGVKSGKQPSLHTVT